LELGFVAGEPSAAAGPGFFAAVTGGAVAVSAAALEAGVSEAVESEAGAPELGAFAVPPGGTAAGAAGDELDGGAPVVEPGIELVPTAPPPAVLVAVWVVAGAAVVPGTDDDDAGGPLALFAGCAAAGLASDASELSAAGLCVSKPNPANP
jgi:hypothetical protein